MRVRDSGRATSDLLRSAGGLLLAAGAVVLLIRKSAHHEWSDLARLLVVVLPAACLYVLALVPPARERDAGEGRAWRAVLLVTAVLLVPLALLLFLRLIGASANNELNEAGVFGVTAALAAYAARRARVPYAALLATLALLAAWLFVWAEVLGAPSADTFRWLLVAGAALLLVLAAWLARVEATGAGEVATAGGIAAVAAGLVGVIAGSVAAAVGGVTSLAGHVPSSAHAMRHPGALSRQSGAGAHARFPAGEAPLPVHVSGLQHFGWDVYLLVVSLALIWLGSRARARGLGYVGGVGLLTFVVSVGVQVTRLEAGRSPTGDIVGWPLVLLVLGVVGLLAPALSRRES